MDGKRGVIMGVANARSIAWGVAKSLHREGAEIALTYASDAVAKRIRPLAEGIGCDLVRPLDVANGPQARDAMTEIGEALGHIDFLVHAVAFAHKEDLKHPLVETPRDHFLLAMDVSVYSLIQSCRDAAPFMGTGGSVLTLSFYGAEKVMPNYNVMGVAKAALESGVRYLASDLGPGGIRVNGLSAGPIRTLAASGIGDFHTIRNTAAERAPLRRNVEIDEVGDAALYLLSPLARGVSGEIHYVDAGYNAIGM